MSLRVSLYCTFPPSSTLLRNIDFCKFYLVVNAQGARLGILLRHFCVIFLAIFQHLLGYDARIAPLQILQYHSKN